MSKLYFSETGILRTENLNKVLSMIVSTEDKDENYYITFYVDRDAGVEVISLGSNNYGDIVEQKIATHKDMLDFIDRVENYFEEKEDEIIEDEFDEFIQNDYTAKQKKLIMEFVQNMLEAPGGTDE